VAPLEVAFSGPAVALEAELVPEVPVLPVISSIVAESDFLSCGRRITFLGPPAHYGSIWKSLGKKYLQKSRVPCNYRLLPFDWAEEELSGPPKRGFGLMFLSAVVFTHCTGSRILRWRSSSAPSS